MTLKQRLKNGDQIRGCMLSELYTPNLSRLFHTLGMDFLLLDCEHGYFDLTQAANLIAVANGLDLPIIVRVGHHSQAAIAKLLDMGAHGILHANITSAKQARALAALCRYAPQGERGVSTFRAHTGYQNGDIPALMRQMNARNLVFAQVEAVLDKDEINAIAQTEGIDGLLIGPNDLSQSIGAFGEYEHPVLLGMLDDVATSARRHGKASGIITANNGLLRRCAAMGMQVFSVGSDLSMLAAGATETLVKMDQMLAKTLPGK